jgi:hypothetical protein
MKFQLKFFSRNFSKSEFFSKTTWIFREFTTREDTILLETLVYIEKIHPKFDISGRKTRRNQSFAAFSY